MRTNGYQPNQISARLPPFPALFFGDTPTTRPAWRGLLKKAWIAGTFDILHPSDVIPIDGTSSEIIISTLPPHNPKCHQKHWWMLWIANDRPPRIRSAEAHGRRSRVFREALIREQRLIVDGMNHLWFAVGMLTGLSNERAGDYRQIFGEEAMREVVLRPMLRSFVGWLPEIIRLKHRFACTALRYSDVETWAHRWFVHILHIFYNLGYKKFREKDWRQAIDNRFHGDIVEALLAKKYIERHGERFQLCEK